MTDEERELFYKTYGNIADEVYIEKIVPQWAETQLDRQNDVGATGMYGQNISKWKEACPFVFMYMHFNCDGTVSPCTLDWPRKVVIGNAETENVVEIWRSQKLRELQIAMLAGKRKCIGFCKSCAAPMVCVEEDLDPHNNKLFEKIGATEAELSLQTNQWVNNDFEKIEIIR
jgi:radical SAM protein with 4Fe4S-binding SPASM domain